MAYLTKFWCVPLATFLALTASPATSIAPPVPEPHDYIGPHVACRLEMAVPVREGEKLHRIGDTDTLYFLGGQLVITTFLEDPVRDADIVHFRGTLEVPSLGQVTRYELTSRNSDYRALGYVYDTGKKSYTSRFTLFRSPQFTGSDDDRAILTHAVGGLEARIMCPGN